MSSCTCPKCARNSRCVHMVLNSEVEQTSHLVTEGVYQTVLNPSDQTCFERVGGPKD
jgi:hypothetical protein